VKSSRVPSFASGWPGLPRVPLPLLFIGALALSLSSALALSQVQQALLAVSGIHPGMKGYGLTVFRGETPERFDVEVIDVLHQFRPDQDLILIRTPHPILDKAITVAGMSGSPIYIDGKLIGAYAYGWTFGKEPVAGVTPIANMLAEINRPIDPHIWKSLGTLPTLLTPPTAASFSARPARESAFANLQRHVASLSAHRDLQTLDTPYGRPVPASTPLLLSGMTDRAMDLLSTQFEPFGLMPVQAGAAGAAPAQKNSAAQFVDGGSIGVQLIRGDVNAMAVGTVTHVEGKRLVAFGHPMLNAGQVGLATCTARVVHVMSSEMRSFKMAEAGTPLGVLIHDRQTAIVVDRDLKADMLPLRVRVHGVPGAPRKEWNMEVASNKLLTSGLVLSALVNALEASVSDRSDAIIEVESRVTIEGHPEQITKDIGYTSQGAADGGILARLRLFAVLGAAYGNPFEDARIKRIDVDLSVRFERDLVSVVDAQLASDTVDPGKPVNVAVTLRHFDESEHVELVSVLIPNSAAGESIELQVEPGDEVDIEQPKPSSLNDMLNAVRAGYPGTSLVVSTKLPSQGVKLRGQLVRSLPGSALDTFQPVNEADRGNLFSTYERKELPLGRAVTGSVKLKLNVRSEPLR
jgi:hypothetical protein